MCQSAYRVGHNTETAIRRVHNDVISSLDKQRDVIFIMPDLSSSFDTLGHDMLVH